MKRIAIALAAAAAAAMSTAALAQTTTSTTETNAAVTGGVTTPGSGDMNCADWTNLDATARAQFVDTYTTSIEEARKTATNADSTAGKLSEAQLLELAAERCVAYPDETVLTAIGK